MSIDIAEETDVQSDDRKLHPGRTMTWKQFHDWLDDKTHAEWLEGEVFIMAPASDPHQMLVTFFGSVLTLYAAKYDLGSIRVAPFQVKMARSGREPDILFVAKANTARIRRTYLNSAPDMVIEILSRSTRSIDQGEKYREYEAAGVREYWLIDPDRSQAAFHRRNQAGIFEPVALKHGIFQSETLPSLRLDVERLWNAPLANIHAIAREMDAI